MFLYKQLNYFIEEERYRMFCQKCGCNLDDDAKFCYKCGAMIGAPAGSVKVIQSNSSNRFDNKPATYGKLIDFRQLIIGDSPEYANKLSDVLVDENEKLIGNVGELWKTNFLKTRYSKRDCLVLSDRRLYFQGKGYGRDLTKPVYTVTEKSISLESIISMGYVNAYRWVYIFLSIVFSIMTFLTEVISECLDTHFSITLGWYTSGEDFYSFAAKNAIKETATFSIIFLALAILFFFLFYFCKRSFFVIEYTGGRIAFRNNVSDIKEFEKKLNLEIQRTRENKDSVL